MNSSQSIVTEIGDSYLGPITAAQGGIAIIGGQGNTNTVFLQETDRLLQSLPGWDLDRVRFDESKACLRDTRQQLLRDIQAWVQSTNQKRILWLSGGAGTGKSSVAHSCAMLFDNSGHLGGTFFFNRDIPKLNSPEYLITNLCYQLALFDHRLKERILCAVQSMGHIPASSLRTQARKLMVKTTTEAKLTRPAVLVVDAVDEAGTPEMREPLLEAIAEEFSNLPDSIKVIITSRDEYDIRTSLEGCSDEICIESAKKTEEDIASYMQYRFSKIRKRARLSPDWPDPTVLQELYLRAGRLFVWASVACNFVESGHDHIRRLDELLVLTNSQQGPTRVPLSKLNVLYTRILRTVFTFHGARPAYFDYVLGSIVVLETPLTCIELDSLLGFSNNSNNDRLVLPDGRIIHLPSSAIIVNSLRSILREDSSGHGQTDGPVRLLHPSLYDFLTSHADHDLRINVIEQHHTLAIRCLQVMNSQLEFDICNIGDAALPNPDISETSRYISAGLRYSCLSFVYHITKVPYPGAMLMCTLKKWACKNILQWIEAMSLLEAVTKAEQCLQNLATWLKDQSNVDELIKMLVDDVIALLRNCGQGVRLSALHTYYSALALTPKTRKLFRYYHGKFPGIPDIVSSHPTWLAASVRILEGHNNAVTSVAFSPNGRKLASASYDNTLRLWDVDSGQLIGDALKGHTNSVNHVVFSPDGEKLASASRDDTLRLWDVDSGQPIGDALKGHTDTVKHVVFSPDGKKLASASRDDTLRLWDVASGQPIGDALKGHINSVNYVVFSPDGKKLASASHDHTLRLWDVDSGQPIGDALKGHTNSVNHIVFSPDGKKLASASWDHTLRLWDVDSGQPIGDALKGHTNWVNHAVFSPDGKKLASASCDHTLRLWDVDSGQPIRDALKGHTDSVEHVVFSPDGKKLASASHDHTLRLWDVDNGQPIGDALKGHTNSVNYVVFLPDGKKLASGSLDSTLRLWDVDSGQPIRDTLKGHTNFVKHIVFSPDGKKLASASYDHTLRLWDVDSGQPIGDALKGHINSVNYVVFLPDGKKLASGSLDSTLRLWDVDSGQPIRDTLKGHTNFVKHIVFSPDGKKLASASYDHTLRLWDVDSGQPIGDALKGHINSVNYVVFSPDGKKLASASYDHTLRLWDVDSGQPIGDALKGHINSVHYVVFSPDGKKLASASWDHTLRLWDVDNGQPIGDALKGHTDFVEHVVFSPDGKKLASASWDHTLRLWDVDSGQPIGDALKGHTNWVNHAVFSPDGKKLASASFDHTLRLWDVDSGQPIGDALKGHTDIVNHVDFSPDGKKLASASHDHTLRLWDVDSGQPIGDALKGHTNSVNYVVFSPDGRTLVSAYSDKTLRLWDVDSGQLTSTANLTFLMSTQYNSCSAPLDFDTHGYLRHQSKRLLWLPLPLRGCAAWSPSSVAIGSPTGAVTFIRWTTTISYFGMHTAMPSAEVEDSSHQVPE